MLRPTISDFIIVKLQVLECLYLELNTIIPSNNFTSSVTYFESRRRILNRSGKREHSTQEMHVSCIIYGISHKIYDTSSNFGIYDTTGHYACHKWDTMNIYSIIM